MTGGESGPVYVTGASRSGKTLLRWILSSHSNILLTRRTDLWSRFLDRFGDLSNSENLERCLDALLVRKQVVALDLDRSQILHAFTSGPPTYDHLFRIVHEHAARRVGKRRWGEQSEGIECCVAAILRAHPDARIVHVVRDPRDRYEAIVERDGRKPARLARTTAEWLASARRASHHASCHPRQYTVIRFERLVREPEAQIRALCDFVGERYEHSMLQMPGARRYDAYREGPHSTPLSVGFLGRGAALLRPRELAFVQRAAADEMREHGYEPVAVPALGWRDRLAYTSFDLSLHVFARASTHAAGEIEAERRRGCREAA